MNEMGMGMNEIDASPPRTQIATLWSRTGHARLRPNPYLKDDSQDFRKNRAVQPDGQFSGIGIDCRTVGKSVFVTNHRIRSAEWRIEKEFLK